MAAALVVVGLVACDGDVDVAPEVTSGEVTAAPSESARITWAEKGDIWLYEAVGGERRRLTDDGADRFQATPRFHGQERVTFVDHGEDGHRGSAVRDVHLRTGEIRELDKLDGAVFTHDWSPDGETLALYVVAGGADGSRGQLHLLTGRGRRVAREFGPIPDGGGYVNYDDTTVQWSPDGTRLIVVDTRLRRPAEDTLFVLHPDGTDAMAPMIGSWARWGSDSVTMYCACVTGPSETQGGWQAVDTHRGTGRPLPIDQGSRPSLSPDGRTLAFDDGDRGPAVHLLDLAGDAPPRRVADGAVGAVWLEADHLVVTDTRPCPRTPDDCLAGGHGAMFEPAGTTSVVTLATGERRTIPLPEMQDADVVPGRLRGDAPAEPAAAADPPAVVAVDFLDDTTGWAVMSRPCDDGHCLVVYASADGGSTWRRRSEAPLAVPGFAHRVVLRMASPAVGWLHPMADTPTERPAPLLETHDGGRTWLQAAADGEVIGMFPHGDSVWRLERECSSAPCKFSLRTSDDQGATWTAPPKPPPDSGVVLAMVRPSRDVAYVLSDRPRDLDDGRPVPLLARTTDGGRSWAALTPPCAGYVAEPGNPGADLAASEPMDLWLVCRDEPGSGAMAPKHLFRSSDGGEHWSEDLGTPNIGAGGSTAAASPQRACRGGSRTGILCTFDGGRTWESSTLRSGQENYFDGGVEVLEFLGQTGWALGWQTSPPNNLWRTTDSGRSWSPVTVG